MRMTLWKLYIREYRLRSRKTAMITFAIFWGTLSILLLMAFGRGLSQASRKGFLGLGTDLVMLRGGSTSRTWQGLPKARRIRMYREDIGLLQEMVPEIGRISPEAYNQYNLTVGSRQTNRGVHGVWPSFGMMRNQIPQAGGRYINEEDEAQGRRVIFLGWKVAAELFGHESPLGQKVWLNRTPFTVVGVMAEKIQTSNYDSPDGENAYIPFSTFCLMDAQLYLDVIHLQPRNREDALLLEWRSRQILGRKYRFDPEDSYALSVWNAARNMDQMKAVFVGIEAFLTIMGGLTLLVGAVGVTNLMYALVRERTREIGVKMAIGARRRHVVRQFLFEAMAIFARGSLWGILVSWVVVGLVRRIPLSNEDFGLSSFFLRPEFSGDILALFLVIMGGIVFLSGIFPAMRASRLNPIEALRYE